MDAVASIEKSLDNLEEVLEPLFEQDLSQTLSNLDLLQKAKLQVLIPYVVNDLVFMYLKTRGINPKTHAVAGELDRIKQYFDKIKNTEDPEKRRFAVDQEAATRFIKHAIKESQATQEQAQSELGNGTHTRFSSAKVVGSATSAAAMAKIKARESENHEESSSEETELQVFADSSKPENIVAENSRGKKKATPSKRRRRGMDPWTGSHG